MMAGTATERFGGIESDGDAREVARIVTHAFAGGTIEQSLEWLDSVGRERWRVLRVGDRVAASLFTTAMGVYLGGRSVPMGGVVGVGVAPEARGRGLATRLMVESLREQRREGLALSGLFSAKQALYRRVGYEQSGHFVRYRIPMREMVVRRDIDLAGTVLRVRALDDGDREGVRTLYREVSATHDGMLDRGEYVWGRVAKLRGEARFGWVFERGDGGLEGYVYLAQRRKDGDYRQEIVIGDWMARSAQGWAAVMRFVREFASLGDEVQFTGSPSHPVCFLMDDQRVGARNAEYWMLRVLDVPLALSSRGYAPGLRGEHHLRIEDDVLDVGGAFVLRVQDAAGSVERGGRGDVVMNVRTLASVLSGFLSVRQAAGLGLIRGEGVRALTGVFEGGTPAMVDQF